MNVGQLKFERIPNFYEVFSTKKLEDMLSREEMEKYVIGYSALEKHVEITPAINDSEKETWFNEFVKFKEDSRLYASSFGKIEKKMTADGKEEYYILTEWPYRQRREIIWSPCMP